MRSSGDAPMICVGVSFVAPDVETHRRRSVSKTSFVIYIRCRGFEREAFAMKSVRPRDTAW